MHIPVFCKAVFGKVLVPVYSPIYTNIQAIAISGVNKGYHSDPDQVFINYQRNICSPKLLFYECANSLSSFLNLNYKNVCNAGRLVGVFFIFDKDIGMFFRRENCYKLAK